MQPNCYNCYNEPCYKEVVVYNGSISTCLNLYLSLDSFSWWQIYDIFVIFPRRQFAYYSSLFSWKNEKKKKKKKTFQNVVCWNFYSACWVKISVDDILKYSWLSLSRPRLSRITAYLEVKIWSLPIHENLTTDGKYCRKEEKLLLRSNFSSFPQYFQYISNFKSPVTYQFVKCG